MMSGILMFCKDREEIQYDEYIRIKKMLLLVEEYNEYHKNIDSIKFLMLIHNNLNYGFMIDMFKYMRNGTTR